MLLSFASAQPAASLANPEWTRAFPPFRIVGNVYWVGTYDLSTYLITTSEGHILINSGLRETVPLIKAGVEQLGFKLSDVKILTATHGHFDHVAGLAELKRITGASVVMSERDAELLETGGKADFRFGNDPDARFEPVAVDRRLKDGDEIRLGGTVLTAHLNPGHTKGATTFTFDVRDNGKTYRTAIVNMPSINPGVRLTGMPGFSDIADAYAQTFHALKELKFDIFLASHAAQFGLHGKHRPGDPYQPERFVDPQGFTTSLARLEAAYHTQLARDQSAAAIDRDGWISMFDGKALTGWQANEHPESWKVVDGAITGDGPESHLFWMVRECVDCEFRAEVKLNHSGNSGMYFRTAMGPGFPKGYEAQVENTSPDPQKTGSLYGICKVTEQLVPDDTWWTQDITVRGNHIVIKVNDKVVTDCTDPQNRYTRGYLALQQHNPGSVVQYRDLRMRPLGDK